MAQNRLLSFTIPCGKGGLNRMDNYLDFPIEDLAWVDGLTAEHNAWEKEGGASKFNSSALGAAVLTAHDAWNSSPSGSATVPAVTTQKLLTVISSTTNTIRTLHTDGSVLNSQNLAAAPYAPFFVNGVIRNVISSQIMFSLNTIPLYTVPETYALQTCAYPAADWSTTEYPSIAFTHNFRMLCATTLTSIVYMSSPNDHTVFASTQPNTRIMDVFPGDNRNISAGVSWRGRAYIFKNERGIYYIEDSDSNIANWRTIKVTDAVGVAGPGCVVAYEDDVIFLATDGYFYSLSDIQTLGQKSIKPILPAELSDFIRFELSFDKMPLTKGIYYAAKRQIWFSLFGSGSPPYANRRLILDANLPGKIRILWSERDEMACLSTRRNSGILNPIWGDSDGYVWVGDQAARNKDGSGYLGQFETPPFSIFPSDDRFANLKELNVTFKPKGAYDLSLEVHADDALVQTLTLSQQSTGSPTGSFSLDADVVAGDVIGTTVVPLEGEAQRVKFVGKNEEDDETFAIQALNIRHTPGSHHATV